MLTTKDNLTGKVENNSIRREKKDLLWNRGLSRILSEKTKAKMEMLNESNKNQNKPGIRQLFGQLEMPKG